MDSLDVSLTTAAGQFPASRMRRLRQSEALRRLVAETRLDLDRFVMPYFVREGQSVREPIASMPGQFRFSQDELLRELEELTALGINAILLFGIPDKKDEKGSGAWAKDGVVQKAVREIKKRFKDLLVITDVCLCAYTSHGHCGVADSGGAIDNDASLKFLAQTALSHAGAGADMVAPSDMMDGRVRAIRGELDRHHFQDLPILSYAAKYASAFYGPFRDAAGSKPQPELSAGKALPEDRKSYQMDPANLKEAMREIAQDIAEGADIVMVKPALAYMDVIREAAGIFPYPISAYSVSAEYSMLKAGAEKGFLDERRAVKEVMTGFVRAGARFIVTYYAKEISRWKKEENF